METTKEIADRQLAALRDFKQTPDGQAVVKLAERFMSGNAHLDEVTKWLSEVGDREACMLWIEASSKCPNPSLTPEWDRVKMLYPFAAMGVVRWLTDKSKL